VRDYKDEIDEARAKVAHCRIRAERPGSRLEDDFALEKARNRLLTLELRQLKLGQATPGPRKDGDGTARQLRGRRPGGGISGTKQEQMPRTARERAEEAFASLHRPRAGKRREA